MFFRTITALLFFLPWIFRSGLAIFHTQRIGLHMCRAVLQTLSAFGFFIALAVTPLATVTALQFTTPIFAVLIGIVVLGEQVSVRRWSAIIAGFIGTVIIIRPDAASFEWGHPAGAGIGVELGRGRSTLSRRWGEPIPA